MLKKTFFCACVVLVVSAKLYAQVNLQTGSATFSLPMLNWQDDKSRLNSIVALSYTSGNGLKVNDVASCVGQGWNLVAGGVITRMQVGEPDDQKAYNGNGFETDIRRYPNGYLYAEKPAADGCPDALRKYPIYQHKNQLYTNHNSVIEDKQMDYFSFQFNGKAGMFVLDKVNGDYGLSLGDSKMKIAFQRDESMITGSITGKRTTITSFTIQDVDGLIYKFAQHGTTKVLESSFCEANAAWPIHQPKMKGNHTYYQTGFDNTLDPDPNKRYINPYIIGSWYLTEIEDALTHRKIFLTYLNRDIINKAGQDISFNEQKSYAVISFKKSITKSPQISAITYPDGHLATFNYGNDRVDLVGEKVLSSVDFTYSGRFLSKYLLNTSYFILNRYGTPVSDYQKKAARLCLRAVQKIGVDLKEDTPPYIFDYYLGSNNTDDFIPPPFFYAKDIWGFYNGNNSVDHNNGFAIPLNKSVIDLSTDQLLGLCFIRPGSTQTFFTAKPGYAKNGLLRQIIYPTGGTLSYDYEQNTGLLNAVTRNIGGVHVTQTSSTDGGFSNGCSNPLITQYKYILSGAGNLSSIWGLEMPENKIVSNTHYEPEYRKYKWFGCGSFFGCCKFKWQYPGILSLRQSVSLSDIQKAMAVISPVLGVVSMVSTVLNVIKLISAGTGVGYVIMDVIAGLVTAALTCFNNPAKDYPGTVYYDSDLNGASPLPTQFKRVEVIENPGTIGKTVHEFTSNDDYAIWHLTNPTFSAKQRFAPWVYGLPKLTTVFDAGGNKIKETESVYNFNTYYSNSHCFPSPDHYKRYTLLKKPLGNQSCKCLVKNSTSQRNTHWSDQNIYDDPDTYKLPPGNGDISVDIYDMYTGRTELNKSFERVYKPNSSTDYLETTTEYAYNDENYEVNLIKTKRSQDVDFSYTQKNIYYTIDYVRVHRDCYQLSANTTTNAEIIALVQNNILSQVVETNEMISNGSSILFTFDKATLFTTLSNGDIKPSKVLEGRFVKPAYRNFTGDYDYSNLSYFLPPPLLDPANPDYTFYKTAQTFTYEGTSGNLIGLKDEANRLVSNIYDYNDKYIAASVINADLVLDKPAYTSFETSALGGWTLTGTPSYYTNNPAHLGVTGIRCMALQGNQGNSLTAILNPAKPYKLSFWASSAGVAVVTSATATLLKTGPTINGFTYYEYDIASGYYNVKVTVTGATTVDIDELRVFTNAARMSTVTYDPLIGKTSECDENNRITYYEYDNLGRLLFIKDEKRNIVKMYEYNNVSAAKQQGCPGIYYSHLTYETFIKNNCAAGYIGADYIYTIPANKYTSAISQGDADAKAENELLTLGQSTANTSGTCIQLFKNQVQSKVFLKENCQPGYTGTNVTYTVPADRYTSIISLADANQKALDEIDANGDVYASNVTTACVVDNNPDWDWDNTSSYCKNVNGNLPPHLFIKETDINPNSPTYNQVRWSDIGPDNACPAGNYYNEQQNGWFTRNNCGSGLTGASVQYTVAPGTYSSTVSLAAANQLATNDINTNGQNYANAYGDCTSSCVFAAAPGFNKITSNISSSGSTVSFYYVFNSVSGTTSWSSTNQVANINGGCRPSVNRTLTMTESGRTWEVIISTSGSVNIRLLSGTPPSGSGSVGLTGGSYSL